MCFLIFTGNVNSHVHRELMALIAVMNASAKTMRHVQERMVPANAPNQGGQGHCVICPALGVSMGLTVLRSANVKMDQLVIERQVSSSVKKATF